MPSSESRAASLLFDPADLEQRCSLRRQQDVESLCLDRGHERALYSKCASRLSEQPGALPVLNGHDAYLVGLSKARQISLFASLGMRRQRTRVIDDPALAVEAARELEFPVVVETERRRQRRRNHLVRIPQKSWPATVWRSASMAPRSYRSNCPPRRTRSSGSRSWSTVCCSIGCLLLPRWLQPLPRRALASFPESQTACGTRSCRSRAMNRRPTSSTRCDQDRHGCGSGHRRGGVLVDASTGRATFYDVNALSKLVANAWDVIGFDPFVQLVDLIATSRMLGDSLGSRATAGHVGLKVVFTLLMRQRCPGSHVTCSPWPSLPSCWQEPAPPSAFPAGLRAADSPGLQGCAAPVRRGALQRGRRTSRVRSRGNHPHAALRLGNITSLGNRRDVLEVDIFGDPATLNAGGTYARFPGVASPRAAPPHAGTAMCASSSTARSTATAQAGCDGPSVLCNVSNFPEPAQTRTRAPLGLTRASESS